MKTSIRFLAVIFAVAMMVLSFATVSANSFSDVTNETPHAKAIDSLTSLGIIHGYEDNTFKPDLPVRRDEIAKLVYTTFTTSIDAGDGVVTFPDVEANSWAKGYISWCAGMKIVGGYEDGKFKPEGNVTYDEALKMVCAMLGYVDFKPEMWPVDVRLKALVDLNLGEKLADVAGDATLTRAQVAQLFYNAFDEPMYVEPLTEEEKKPGKIHIGKAPVVKTLAADVWGYTEEVAEIVATENWGLVVPYKAKEDATIIRSTTAPNNVDVRTYTKTGKDNVIKLRFLDTEGKAILENGVEKVETLKLEDLGLEAYVGNTDELLTRRINILINKKGEYTSSTLMGNVLDSFSGAYSNPSNVSEEEVNYTHTKASEDGQRYQLGQRYHKYGIKINDITHEYEDFQEMRKLVYLDKAARESLGYPEGSVLVQPATTKYDDTVKTEVIPVGNYYLDSDGNVMNMFEYGAWSGNNNPSLAYEKFSFPRAIIQSNSIPSNRKAIDSDGDGYYEYLVFNYYSVYIVDSVSKKQVKLNSTYSSATFSYDADEFHSDLMPKKGDIIVGYFIGDEFFHVGTANMITAFSTKYVGGNTTLYGYATYAGNTSLSLAGTNSGKTILEGVANSPDMSPYVGFNSVIGNYNYANYYIYDESIVYATPATEYDIKNVTGGQKRAILMFVDKPTEAQINEKTKQYEIFYPAYLIINGKEELVNLKATNAINGSEAATIAQDGSMYRAYINDDGYVMYRNMLVSYEVDADGYYSLTTADKLQPEDGELIVPQNGYFLEIDPSTKIMTIKDASGNLIKDKDGNDITKIIANGTSIIYYPFTKKTTGSHEYIDFYLGSEIPSDFNKIELKGDTYLTLDEETGLYILATAMIGLDGFDSVGSGSNKKVTYKTDARFHLIAFADSDATYDEADEEVYANYYFKGIYEGTDVIGVNKDQEYAHATPATTAGIYAWDEENDNYVAIDEASASSYTEESIDTVIADMSLIFTDDNTSGLKLNETTKIIAIKDVPDNSDEEFLFEEITLEDLDTLLTTIGEYNDLNTASEKLEAKIGTYVDDDKKTQIAYIIVDWVEYNEELEDYTFAGETK